jgi:hypothetical protein
MPPPAQESHRRTERDEDARRDPYFQPAPGLATAAAAAAAAR